MIGKEKDWIAVSRMRSKVMVMVEGIKAM
ncbi:hypothetical protein A2U01_0103090, partial [Trifolium medium]|nr:hypothetical protein [Trifolium medium]